MTARWTSRSGLTQERRKPRMSLKENSPPRAMDSGGLDARGWASHTTTIVPNIEHRTPLRQALPPIMWGVQWSTGKNHRAAAERKCKQPLGLRWTGKGSHTAQRIPPIPGVPVRSRAYRSSCVPLSPSPLRLGEVQWSGVEEKPSLRKQRQEMGSVVLRKRCRGAGWWNPASAPLSPPLPVRFRRVEVGKTRAGSSNRKSVPKG